jgi:hypothetical protein
LLYRLHNLLKLLLYHLLRLLKHNKKVNDRIKHNNLLGGNA